MSAQSDGTEILMINTISFPHLGLKFTLSRVAFSIGGFPIYAYGLTITIGLILAVIYGFKQCKPQKSGEKITDGLGVDDYLNMLLLAIPISIICARIYYVVFSFDAYKDNLLSVFDIRGGGLAIYGGVIGAVLTIFVYCRKNKINMGTVLDILSIGLLIGQSIGRWGNFVNGEAFGSETTLPWAMTIEQGGAVIANSVHPTFFYESLWNAIGIAVLMIYKKHTRFRGELFCAYLVWYGIGRTIIEGLRTDSLYLGPLRVSQVLAAVAAVVGVVLIIRGRRKAANSTDVHV